MRNAPPRAVLMRAVSPPEIYILPHNYPLVVGAIAVVLNPQRMPVESFIIQSANANTNTVFIGDSSGNAINGLEMVPGQAWQFSVSSYSENTQREPSPMNFATSVRSGTDQRKVLDLNNWWVIADPAILAAQIVKVFYTLPTKGY
jgi:hypothetical protein